MLTAKRGERIIDDIWAPLHAVTELVGSLDIPEGTETLSFDENSNTNADTNVTLLGLRDESIDDVTPTVFTAGSNILNAPAKETLGYRSYISTHIQEFIFDPAWNSEKPLDHRLGTVDGRPIIFYAEDAAKWIRYAVIHGYLRLLRRNYEDLIIIGIGRLEYETIKIPRRYEGATGNLVAVTAHALLHSRPTVYRYLFDELCILDAKAYDKFIHTWLGACALDELKFIVSKCSPLDCIDDSYASTILKRDLSAAQWAVAVLGLSRPYLHAAVENGNVEAAEWVYKTWVRPHLNEMGVDKFPCPCDICKADHYGYTGVWLGGVSMFHTAISANNIPMLNWLWEHVEPSNRGDHLDFKYISISSDVLRWLINHPLPGVDVDAKYKGMYSTFLPPIRFWAATNLELMEIMYPHCSPDVRKSYPIEKARTHKALCEWQNTYENVKVDDFERMMQTISEYLEGFDRIAGSSYVSDGDTNLHRIADYLQGFLYIHNVGRSKPRYNPNIRTVIYVGFTESPRELPEVEKRIETTYIYPAGTIDEIQKVLPKVAAHLHLHLKRGDHVAIISPHERSRSVVCILWYLVHYHYVTLLKAITYLKSRCPEIRPSLELLRLCL
jgi:hypothetical protein